MADYFLRPKARKDLEDIWLYSNENWGEEQADSYIHDLDSEFRVLAVNPKKGFLCDDIREGYRKYPTGMHIIFYRQTNKRVEIVRILHQRMDLKRHF